MNYTGYDEAADNPAMHHKMNMASLASSQDQSGNGRNGTVFNGQDLINQVAGAIPDLSDSALRVGRTTL